MNIPNRTPRGPLPSSSPNPGQRLQPNQDKRPPQSAPTDPLRGGDRRRGAGYRGGAGYQGRCMHCGAGMNLGAAPAGPPVSPGSPGPSSGKPGRVSLDPTWPQRPFVGKGPKNYSRTDDRLREEICERLSDGQIDASDIEVTVHRGEVILTGTVSDRLSKRMAEQIADRAPGIKDIQNRLTVQSEGQPKPGGQAKPESPKILPGRPSSSEPMSPLTRRLGA